MQGSLLSRYQILNGGKACHFADWNWNNVNSPFARIFYVVSGSAELVIGNEIIRLQKDYLYLIPPYTRHSYRCHDSFCLYYVHIYEDNTNSLGTFDRMTFPFKVNSSNLDGLLIERLCDINPELNLEHSDPKTYDNNQSLLMCINRFKSLPVETQVESIGIVTQIFSRFLSNAVSFGNTTNTTVNSAIMYIQINISTIIPVDELASEVFVSTNHFIRIFKNKVGISPLKYITKKKIEKAQLLLLTESSSIKSIALSLGYSDLSYFDRVFKKNVGQTPLEYRSQSPSAIKI